MSCHLVQVNIASLHNATLDFLGTTLNFLGQPGIKNAFTFSSEDGDEATFTVDTELGAVWGHAQLADGRDFIIEPNLDNCKGCHVVIEENQEAFPEDHAEAPPPSTETRSNSAQTRAVKALLDMGKTDKTTVVTYTIKLYYTPEVKNSVDDLKTMADQVLATTNQGYINSEIPLRARLHCMEETEEPDAYFTKDLNDFRKYKGGDNGLRGSADAAVLLFKDQGVSFCGVGFVNSDTTDFGRMMVSITRLDCALEGYTFGHEIGHNMGLDHDKYEVVKSSRGRITPYSQGYHLPGTKYRTILAYNRRAQEGNRQRINHYSNPDVKFQDVPTGSNEADAARRITEVRFVIATIGDESQACTTCTSCTPSGEKDEQTSDSSLLSPSGYLVPGPILWGVIA